MACKRSSVRSRSGPLSFDARKLGTLIDRVYRELTDADLEKITDGEGLTDDEKAFYDALAANDSAVTEMGDDKLKLIAAELITQVKKSVAIDWTLRESARAKIKVTVKRILYKHGYPPDLQESAVKTVLAQAELLCAESV